MARSYSPAGLVSLPRVDANAAVALAKSVESAAAEQGNLEPALVSSLGTVTSKRETLQTAKGMGESPVTVQEADRQEDDVVCALYALLVAWARLAAYIAQGKTAQALIDRLFGDGVAFVNYKVKEEWAVVDTILKAIKDENLEPDLVSLGAGPMLEHLKAVHTQYGDVIGTTKPEPESAEVGEKRDALLDALRFFVVRVVSSVEPGNKATEDRAAAILRPIMEWKVDKPKAKSPDQPSSPADPGAGAPTGGGGAEAAKPAPGDDPPAGGNP